MTRVENQQISGVAGEVKFAKDLYLNYTQLWLKCANYELPVLRRHDGQGKKVQLRAEVRIYSVKQRGRIK